MSSYFFYLLGTAINIYIWMCIIRIFLSWSPALLMNGLGQFFCELCDPYLAYFRRFKFTQLGGLDFSPVLSLGLLSLLKNICFSISESKHFSILKIGIILISSFYQLVEFVLNIFVLLALLRFILDFSYKYRSSFFCAFIDNIFKPIRMFIIKYMFGGRWQKERWALLLIFLLFLLINIAFRLAIYYLIIFFDMLSILFL